MNIYDFIKIRKKENQIYVDDLVKIFPMNKYSIFLGDLDNYVTTFYPGSEDTIANIV